MKNTKYWQSIGAQIISSTALFTGHIDQSIWLTATLAILGIYSASNVLSQKVAANAEAAK